MEVYCENMAQANAKRKTHEFEAINVKGGSIDGKSFPDTTIFLVRIRADCLETMDILAKNGLRPISSLEAYVYPNDPQLLSILDGHSFYIRSEYEYNGVKAGIMRVGTNFLIGSPFGYGGSNAVMSVVRDPNEKATIVIGMEIRPNLKKEQRK